MEEQKKERQNTKQSRNMDRYRVLMVCIIVIACLTAGLIVFFRYRNSRILRVGIFYGSNWEVPGTAHYDIIDQAAEIFQEQYNVKITYEEGIPSDDYSEWLAGRILEGDEPDIYLILDDDFTTLASIGALEKLDSHIESDDSMNLEQFYSATLDAGQYNGVQYALPFECNPTMMFVNKKLLVDHDISMPDRDWTWDDFYEICKKLQDNTDSDSGQEQFGCYGYTWEYAMYANGIAPFNAAGTVSNFTDSRATAALNFLKELTSLTEGHQIGSNDFDLGKVAFRPLTFSEYRTYMPYPWRIRKYSDLDWDCLPMPAGPSGDNVSVMEELVAGISSRSANKTMAWEFLKVLTSDESIQKLIYKDTAGASALRSVTRDSEVVESLNQDTPGDSSIDMSLLNQVMEDAVVAPHFSTYETAYDEADRQISQYLSSDNMDSSFIYELKNSVDKIMQK